jgi:hypothetical protein
MNAATIQTLPHKHEIIVLSGRENVGKDEITKFLTSGILSRKNKSVKIIKMSSDLKNVISTIFGWDRLKLEGYTEEDRIWRNESDKKLTSFLEKDITPKKALILMGEGLKDIFGDNIWLYKVRESILNEPEPSIFIIPDCRFPNEYVFFKENNATFIHINSKRNSYPPIVYSEDFKIKLKEIREKIEIPFRDRVYMVWEYMKGIQTEENKVMELFSILIDNDICEGQTKGIVIRNDFPSVEDLYNYLSTVMDPIFDFI